MLHTGGGWGETPPHDCKALWVYNNTQKALYKCIIHSFIHSFIHLSDFERGMVVGARRTGLSISKTADLLGFSHATISRVYREWSEKEKISSEWQLCGRKWLVDVRGQRRMGRLVRDDRKATVTQITARYNQGMQNIISEHTTRRTLKQMGYSSRRSLRVPLLSVKNRKRSLYFTQTHQNWTIEYWKNIA